LGNISSEARIRNELGTGSEPKTFSACHELLRYCLTEQTWPDPLLDRAIAEDEGRAILSIVVEKLGDLFEPRLCEVYDRLFTQIVEHVEPQLVPRLRKRASHSQSTSARSKTVATPPATVDYVYVLSRVTLGADVAVTSVLLDAAKKRYPEAQIVYVAPEKSAELFAADPRVQEFGAPYVRGGPLLQRLHCTRNLWISDGIVIDPDSRLSQLGLISVCDEDRYFHFESRSYGGEGDERLPEMAARWAQEVFGVEDARPYIAPRAAANTEAAEITVSLGVGENIAKRLGDEFERDLIGALAETDARVLIDMGGSIEERDRVEQALGFVNSSAVNSNGANTSMIRTHEGAFAPFAAEVARSKLYVGYDSAGGHVASACGVPVISIFAGAVSDRFFARWNPCSRAGGEVIRGEDPDVKTRVRRAIEQARARF
jgi:ADP-heptose:LPS heptosyltransferase